MAVDKESTQKKLKAFCVDTLRVEEAGLEYDTPLFGDGVGLDSVDAMEIVSFIDEEFGVSVEELAKDQFPTINAIADYIVAHAE